MNEFDQFVKHDLKIKHYLRYTDDFAIVSENRKYLESLLPSTSQFLEDKLALQPHPKKIILRPSHQGIDFLGYIILPHYKQLRTKTKQRVFKKIKIRITKYKSGTITRKTLEQSLQSYIGVLSHADTHNLTQEISNKFLFWMTE